MGRKQIPKTQIFGEHEWLALRNRAEGTQHEPCGGTVTVPVSSGLQRGNNHYFQVAFTIVFFIAGDLERSGCECRMYFEFHLHMHAFS